MTKTPKSRNYTHLFNENCIDHSSDSNTFIDVSTVATSKDIVDETAREKFRELALRENKITNKEENQFPIPIRNQSYEESETAMPKKANSSSKNSEVVKVEPPAGSSGIKTFNDFNESIFKMDESGIFRCPVPECAKEFPSLSRIKRHYIIHTDIKPFKCKNKECERRFSRKDNMLQHYRMHCPYTRH